MYPLRNLFFRVFAARVTWHRTEVAATRTVRRQTFTPVLTASSLALSGQSQDKTHTKKISTAAIRKKRGKERTNFDDMCISC